MKKTIISIAFAALAAGASATTADELVELIMSHNPSLSQSALDANAELLDLKTENNLAPTEVEFSHLWGNEGEKKMGVGVSQSFDWPGVYAARSAAYGSLARLQEARLNLRRADLQQQVSALIIAGIAQKQRIGLLDRLSSGFAIMLEGARKERANGSITIIDLNKIELQASKASVALSEAQSTLEEIVTELSLLASTDIKAEMLPEQFDMADLRPLSDYMTAATESSPEVIEAMAQADYMGRMQKVASRESLPGFKVGYEFEREGGQSFNGLAVGVELPLFSSRGKSAAARASVLAAEFNAATVKNNLSRRLTSAYNAASNYRNRMNALGPVIDRYDNFALLKKLFDSRQISLSDYLIDVNYFLEASLEYIDICAAYHASLLPLDRYL